ncbi:ROK family protein [Frigidibacter sp. RF13]|uniref:ROK family protein n=1 Tax=Frigidibacter sp. RF13 TaxID=2997340 RepID=UPI00226F8159|nr:ROK family protein [Frigidibacter sp. RF13]MCY1128666.1 ROK family protein [Frigidibacter sp. RF13]
MIVAFDIGGTQIRAAEVRAPGALGPVRFWPTPGTDFEVFAGVLREAARGADRVHLSIAGIVDPLTGKARIANIPCLDGRLLASDLGRALGCRVLIANDADCFTLAEARSGAGIGHEVVFGVILGTGAGGGLVIGGRLHRGARGVAGEWGHGPVMGRTDVPAWPCGCGLSGCADTVAGARGLERLDAHLTGGGRDSRAILSAWAEGQVAAGRTVDLWLDMVSGPLAMVMNVIGPSVAPVGGGLGRDVRLVAALDRAVRARMLAPPDVALLVPALHQVEPGLIGASYMAEGI